MAIGLERDLVCAWQRTQRRGRLPKMLQTVSTPVLRGLDIFKVCPSAKRYADEMDAWAQRSRDAPRLVGGCSPRPGFEHTNCTLEWKARRTLWTGMAKRTASQKEMIRTTERSMAWMSFHLCRRWRPTLRRWQKPEGNQPFLNGWSALVSQHGDALFTSWQQALTLRFPQSWGFSF